MSSFPAAQRELGAAAVAAFQAKRTPVRHRARARPTFAPSPCEVQTVRELMGAIMRATTEDQAKILSQLAEVAGGDLELVQRAIRALSRDNQPADSKEVVRYIVRERADQARLRREVPQPAR
jgi:hypothetical protein